MEKEKVDKTEPAVEEDNTEDYRKEGKIDEERIQVAEKEGD